ncbi:MAG: DUF2007 domain-containing protein, partial [Planctomycetaceae bacterium]|nr:DUF2007 domain-containing protein [Planctomycetaceae bacterium]
MTEIVEVYAAANDVEAAVLIDLLGQNGIIARVAGGLLNGHIAELPGAIESAPRIWVNQADAER